MGWRTLLSQQQVLQQENYGTVKNLNDVGEPEKDTCYLHCQSYTVKGICIIQIGPAEMILHHNLCCILSSVHWVNWSNVHLMQLEQMLHKILYLPVS